MRMISKCMLLSIILALNLTVSEGSNSAFAAEPSPPEKDFEVLWQTFRDRYAFFEIRGVDWQKQYEIYRPRVSEKTTPNELFSIMCDMLKPLKDGHVTLKRKGKKEFCADPGTRFYQEFDDDQIEALFRVSHKTLKAHKFGNMKEPVEILHYSKSEDFGYMRILAFEGIKVKHLSAALDEIMGEFEELKGVIIDIRDNPGGDDKIAYDIANRFVDEKRIGHYKKTKNGPAEADFGPLETWYLMPQGEKPFAKPVVLVTHGASFSAADVFALAMKQLPHVTVVGEPTNGIFSDELEKKLPNGWKFSLSHQRYYSPDMVCYEGKGVPVDITVLNTRKDLAKGEDTVIAKALKLLEDKKTDR